VLFGKSRNTSYSLPVLKHIAEIIVGNDSDLYNTLRTVSAEEIVSTLKSRNVFTESTFDQIREYVKYLRSEDDFISWFNKQLTMTMTTYNDFNLPYEYSKVKYVEKQLRAKLERDIRKYISNKRADFSDADWSVIMHDFSTNFLEKYSDDWSYDASTNGIVPFIVKAFSFYMKSKSSFLTKIINTTGVNTNLDNSDFSRADYTTVEVTYFEDLVGFDKLAFDIYQVSNFMYRHNQRVFYDLFSRYKFKLAQRKFDEILAIYNNAFEYAGVYRKPSLVDINFQVSNGISMNTEKYAYTKAKDRDKILSLLDPLLRDEIGPQDLPVVIDNMMEQNKQIYIDSRGGDQRPVFSYLDYNPKDGLNNDTRIKLLIVGMSSLRDLLKYLEKMNINVFRVPSDVFKDVLLTRRHKTFREYQELYTTIKELRSAEDENYQHELMTNDQFYDDIIASQKISGVRAIPLVNIKDAIDQYNNKRQAIKSKVSDVIFDPNRVAGSYQKLGRLTGNYKHDKFEFAESFRVVVEKIVPKLLKHVQDTKVLSTVNNIFWKVDELFNFEEFVVENWGQAVYNGLSDFIYPYKTDSDRFLSFLRSIDFITNFTKFVAKAIDLVAKNKAVATELKAFLIMSENIELFTMPIRPKHNDEFKWFQDNFSLSYYVPFGWELQDINSHLVKLYNKMHDEFSMLFRYLEELYSTMYAPLNDKFRLVEQNPYDLPESSFAEASFNIYRSGKPASSEFENFNRFRKLCDTDKYGFLFRKGKLYKKEHIGAWRYLHVYGYWIWFRNGKSYKMTVGQRDEF
jgi:hypothetical protein